MTLFILDDKHRGMDLLDSRPSDGSLGEVDNVTLFIYADDVKDQMHI